MMAKYFAGNIVSDTEKRGKGGPRSDQEAVFLFPRTFRWKLGRIGVQIDHVGRASFGGLGCPCHSYPPRRLEQVPAGIVVPVPGHRLPGDPTRVFFAKSNASFLGFGWAGSHPQPDSFADRSGQ